MFHDVTPLPEPVNVRGLYNLDIDVKSLPEFSWGKAGQALLSIVQSYVNHVAVELLSSSDAFLAHLHITPSNVVANSLICVDSALDDWAQDGSGDPSVAKGFIEAELFSYLRQQHEHDSSFAREVSESHDELLALELYQEGMHDAIYLHGFPFDPLLFCDIPQSQGACGVTGFYFNAYSQNPFISPEQFLVSYNLPAGGVIDAVLSPIKEVLDAHIQGGIDSYDLLHSSIASAMRTGMDTCLDFTQFSLSPLEVSHDLLVGLVSMYQLKYPRSLDSIDNLFTTD